MTYPVTEPTSYPLPTSWSNSSNQQASDYNNTESVGNYSWGGTDAGPTRARVATTGSETYTIASGSVTVINGTTIDGVSVSVNDVVLIATAPASSGTGTAVNSGGVGTTQPGNGLYYVTAVSTNISLSRLPKMSSASSFNSPAGAQCLVGNAGTANGLTMWFVISATSGAAFTYGTTAMTWAKTINSPNLISPTIGGTGIPNTAIQQAGINNFNHANQSQVVVSGTAYYMTNSGLLMPSTPLNGMVANKTTFTWDVTLLKTAAGTGTFQIVIYRGTNGSTSDTADVTQTVGTQTAAIDTLNVEVQLTITTTGSSGAYYWTINAVNRDGISTGFAIPPTAVWNGTVSSVNLATSSLIFGLGFISTTGTPTITIPQMEAIAYNMN